LPPGTGHGSNSPVDPPLDPDDQYLVIVRELLQSYGGVIFVGPPGTSKTWYAAKVATALVNGDRDRVRFIQFHPSYQYEDFVEGFVPLSAGGGFELADKHLLQMCDKARTQRAVLVIDELSRGDPGRIFGEALTYVEKTKRNLPFQLASGRECKIPEELVFLATMNPLDRGVDEVDAAFERRFGKIAMEPDVGILESFLDSNSVADPLRHRLLTFFTWVNNRAKDNPFAQIGHTFFLHVRNEEDLRRLWDHQLRFVFEKAYQLDPDGHQELRQQWDRIFRPRPPSSPAPEASAGETPVDSLESS
jgi:5-methylcytosine-specific restriction protein B